MTDYIMPVVSLVLLALTVSFKDWLWEKVKSKFDDLFQIKHRETSPGAKEIEGSKQIQDALIELRGLTKCDRARVWQFHNGSVFSSRNALWRITCTHESCGKGIASNIGGSQNIIASAFLELLEPLFGVCTAATKTDWFIRLCRDQECEIQDSKNITPVYWFTVDAMPDGYCKSLFKEQGVEYLMISPLLSSAKNMVGFVTSCYYNKVQLPPTNEDITEFHDSVSSINFALQRGS